MDPINQPSASTPSSSDAGNTQFGGSTMKETPAKPAAQWVNRVLNGMSLYGLELALSVVGLLVTLGVVTYGVFALINYWIGIENPLAQQFMGEFSLWITAMMIVWLPLTLFFYVRSRREADRNPASEKRFVHKLIVGLYIFNVIVMIAGLFFTVVYALIRMAIGIDDQAGDTALRVIVPSLIAIVITAGFLLAYSRRTKPSRKVFMIVLASISMIVTVALLSVSVATIQGSDRDQKAVEDLSAISSEVQSYYSDKEQLPDSLNSLQGLKSETKDRLSKYRYVKENDSRYQLCATFATDTAKSYGYEASSASYGPEYSMYPSFSSHGTGEKCFKLVASYADMYQYDYKDYLNSDTSDSSMY